MTAPTNIIPFPGDMTNARSICPRGALTRAEAARYLSIGMTQLWKLFSTGKIKRTSYGTYTIDELNRHLKQETEEA